MITDPNPNHDPRKKFKKKLQGKNYIMDPKPNHDHGSETES